MKRLFRIYALCLFQLVLFAQAGRAVDTYTTTYRVYGGDIHEAGETVSISGVTEEGDCTVATLTFGVDGDDAFESTTWDYRVDGYEAYFHGNGKNGGNENGVPRGSIYIIRPNYNGFVTVAVVLNPNKSFYIQEDDKSLDGFDGLTVDTKYYGTYTFSVKAGSTYKVYATGSKLGFYGFSYTYSTDATAVLAMYTMELSSNVKNDVSFSQSRNSIHMTGETVWLETWCYKGDYRFKHWTANGEVVSTNRYFGYTMPANDVNLVAVYEFNPTNPGDPSSAENAYKLTLVSQPANAGYFDRSSQSKVQAGQQTTVYTNVNKNGFVFREWQIDGEKVSSQRDYTFDMPAKNLTLTAIYEFKPTNPSNPGTNTFADGELMLDDFSPDDYYSPAYQAVGGEWDKVKTITLVGEINRWTVYDLSYYCNNSTEIDVSRTTGLNVVYGRYVENEYLTTISLPSTVEKINSNAFVGCPNLTTLNIFALTPPELSKTAFGEGDNSIASQVTVFVPAAVKALYETDPVWSTIGVTILPLTSEVCDLEVSLPDDINPSIYKDMYLEAYDVKSGQLIRYVMTGNRYYTFSSIIKNSTWNIELKNTNGELLGKIEGVDVGDNSTKVTFQNLKVPRSVTLKVLDADQNDVTASTTVTWTKNDNFLAQGAEIKGLLADNKLKYNVTLSEALAMQYQLPAGGEYTVKEQDENTITVQLETLPKVTINGTVTDKNENGTPLEGAIIAVSQTVNGQYSKTFVAKTNGQGIWSLEVFDAPTEITASKTGYVSETKSFEAIVTPVTFDLRNISGTTITLNLRYQDLEGQQTDYADWANVAYTVVNSTGETLTGWSLQFPKIVMQEKLEEGTQLTITATSKNQKFVDVTAIAEVNNQNKAEVTLTIKQLGGIKASYTRADNNACVGILYDGNGQLVKRYEYIGNNLVISELKDGDYTLVTMANSQLLNSVGQLSQFGESGLRNGVDFLRNAVTVKSGKWTIINNMQIPYLDETKLYYTGPNTSFTANKSQVTAGQYLTLRGQVDFKGAYANKVSNVEMVVDLTNDCEFVNNSVMLGKNLTGYTLNGKQLIVPIGNSTEQVRFCVIPTKEGSYEPSASVRFTIGNKTILQPIGSAQTEVKGVTITVPATVAKPQFTASGTAIAKSEIYVYVDELLVGKTVVKANGKWSVQCELPGEEEKGYPVYARVVTPQKAELFTDTKTVTYDKDAILAEKVGMSFYNGWMGKTITVDWNMIEKKVNPASYMFYTATDFTFTISFTNNDNTKITNVQLLVYKTNNSFDVLNAKYNATKKIWVASNRYSSWALPTAVKVKYEIDGAQQTLSEDKDDEGIEHSSPILDPSGYVYEAVSSNRLQGVTASIYYKETRYNEYDDPYEVEGLWDAEEYAQQNPQFTDENGMYSWDVPNGLWQVRLEKDGYLKTNSEWLPVPPPQLDINLSMTQMSQPEVKNFKVSDEGVEVEFDKYMDPATLTTENIYVQRKTEANTILVPGKIELLNEEKVSNDNDQTYASKLFFRLDEKLLPTDEAEITIKKTVKSYAGIPMQKDWQQDKKAEPVVKRITIDSDIDLVNVGYGNTRPITVAVQDLEAAKGKQLYVQSMSELVATVNNGGEFTLSDEGQIDVTITGELPGSTVLVFSVEGSDVQKQLTVNVMEPEKLTTVAPRASRVTGAKLYRGDKIQLSSETENAVIKYTLNGSDPSIENNEAVLTYNADEPIVINDDNVTIKTFAQGQDMKASDVASFSYELKKSTIGLSMPEGWTWMSHNLENAVSTSDFPEQVERIVSQTSEVIRDPQFGLVGGLTQLESGLGYKIKVNANAEKTIQGFELNANENIVSVKAGWNWIGYPLSQEMPVGDALTYFEATKGDMIVGQNVNAVFDGTKWQGELTAMQPGRGYLFKTATTADIQFNTNYVVEPGSLSRRNWLIGSPWTYNKHAYPNIMPVTAEFFVDGAKSTDSEFVIAAFAGDECRGVGQWHEGRLMMNVFGDGGEKISFMAYNKQSKQYFDVAETFTFKADNEGTWFAPARLTLGNKSTDIETLNSDLSVTPAVARDHITVSAGGRYISSLSLTDMGGVTVLSVHDLGTGATITTGSLESGVYILTIKAEGKTYYQKILKANK